MDHITKLENYKKAADLARAEQQKLANGYLVDKTTREKVDTDLKEQGCDAEAILRGRCHAALLGRRTASRIHDRNRQPAVNLAWRDCTGAAEKPDSAARLRQLGALARK